MSKIREQRFYTYTFELYLESVQEDFMEELKNLHCKVALALHDKDIYSEADLKKYQKNNDGNSPNWKVGDIKKPHYHIVLRFENLKSINGVLSMLAPLDVKHVKVVQNERGMIRYLIHIDDAEKYQYKREDIITLCDYKIDKFFECDKDVNEIYMDLQKMLSCDKDEDYCFDYALFSDYITYNFGVEYVKILMKHNTHFRNVIASRIKQKEYKKYNKNREEEKELEVKEIDEKELEVKEKVFNKYIKEEFNNIIEEELQNKKDSIRNECNRMKAKHNIEKFFCENGKEEKLKDIIQNEYEQQQKEMEEKIFYIEAKKYIKKYDEKNKIKN